MNVIEASGLTKIYGRTSAVNNLTFTLEENKITGLIGRNGAGKTTLLKIVAGFLKPSAGNIRVFGDNPFNSIKVSANTVFIDDSLEHPQLLCLEEILRSASSFYHNWDHELAKGLFAYFDFGPKLRYSSLSKGMKSTFNMIIGLAARCPLTILDEPTTGMDAAIRKDFYKALLQDYLAHPRTIIISSHLLGEIEDVLEDILLIKQGTECVHMPVSDLKELAVGLRGKASIIDSLVQGKEVLHCESFGKDSTFAVVKNNFSKENLQAVKLAGVDLLPVPLDDVCNYLTAKTKGGIEHVFNRN